MCPTYYAAEYEGTCVDGLAQSWRAWPAVACAGEWPGLPQCRAFLPSAGSTCIAKGKSCESEATVVCPLAIPPHTGTLLELLPITVLFQISQHCAPLESPRSVLSIEPKNTLIDACRTRSDCYDLTPCHTIIQMSSSDFHDAAYCKDLYLFMVRHVHIFLCHTRYRVFHSCANGLGFTEVGRT
jgi:hypothetical protein